MDTLLKRWSIFAESLGLKRWILVALFGGVLLPLAIFGGIADEVRDGDDFKRDAIILNALHDRSNPTLDAIMVFITQLGRAWVLVPFCMAVVAFLLWKKLPRQAFFFTVATFGAGLLNLLAKVFFGRARPDLWVSIAPEHDYSFPSGHAMASMAVAAALVLLCWPTRFRWGMIAIGFIYVAAVGLTRPYLGVHYPSDIVGGWCASLAWVGGVHSIIYARQQWMTRAERLKTAVTSANEDRASL
jgi:undecaprenyl-diphosphatase